MKKYGLIGKSLGHSFSKAFFTDYFLKNQIAAEYTNFELAEISDFNKIKSECEGFNVTIPYKEAVIPYLDDVSDVAKSIGAVNTIVKEGNRYIGHNTDAYGFHQSIKPFLTNRHERAIIIGTGGASKAIAFVLEGIGVDVIYISRNPKMGNQFGYDEVNPLMLKACKLIVNCTPLGTSPNLDEMPPINLDGIGNEHLVVDLIYNPVKTKLLLEAEKRGASILNGESMLRMQALKSFEIWSDNV